MQTRALGRSSLRIAPLVLGTNVFGWTADERTSFAILDAFVDAGFNAIDTADIYSAWAPGHEGGEAETIIGRWLKADPAKRDKVLIFTKVGTELGPGKDGGSAAPGGLSEAWITDAVEASLRRLRTDVIDLYQSHWPDARTPYEDTLRAYQKLLDAGKVRAIGASNLDAGQLADALAVARREDLPRYETLQPMYNLYDRTSYDGPLRDLAIREGLGVIAYFGLAAGFLTGKYRSRADLENSRRSQLVARYLNDRGERILSALDHVSGGLGAKPGEVALAWLMAREGVTAPIASATSVAQFDGLARAARLALPADAVATLDQASA